MASKEDEKNETTSLLGGPGKGGRARTLTRLSLVAIMYFSVAGGPEVGLHIPENQDGCLMLKHEK